MAQSLLARARGLQDHERVAAYDDLLHRLRQRILDGLGDLSGRRVVDVEIMRELWLIAKELPSLRRDAQAAARSVGPDWNERAAQIGLHLVRDGA
jgi:hypothetical protein